ncbi:hypothetical protein ADL04_26645 [Streptomyces sp. NRRL B-3648]|nr:hypothetical protein ADL04_26645 [Streptomyces sp. NRRL B-3648]
MLLRMVGQRDVEDRGGAEVGRGELVGQDAAGAGDLGGGDAEGAGQEGVGYRRQRPAVAGAHGGGAGRTAGGQLLPGGEQSAQVGHRGIGAAARGAVGDGGEEPAVLADGGQDVLGQVQDRAQRPHQQRGHDGRVHDRDVVLTVRGVVVGAEEVGHDRGRILPRRHDQPVALGQVGGVGPQPRDHPQGLGVGAPPAAERA